MLLSLSAVVFLYVFWLLLSGFFTPFLMAAGLGCAVAVVLFARRMAVMDQEGHPIQLGWRILGYWAWLMKEIVKSSWQVTRIVLHPQLPISPTMISFKPSQRTAVGLVVHANSITLTPGTIAVEAEADRFLVHGLTRDSALGTVDSEMDARVTRCEERSGVSA